MISCQIYFKRNRCLALYQDNISAWSLVVHGFSGLVPMSDGGNVYHLVRGPSESTSGQSMCQVWARWSTWQVVGQSATQTTNFADTWRSSKIQHFPSWVHAPVANWMDITNLPLWQDQDGDTVRPCTDLSLWEAPGRNRISSLLLLNPVRLLLLLVEVVSSACRLLFELDGIAEGVSPLSF